MIAKDDRKNAEGYNDPTAYNAIKNAGTRQRRREVSSITKHSVFAL